MARQSPGVHEAGYIILGSLDQSLRVDLADVEHADRVLGLQHAASGWVVLAVEIQCAPTSVGGVEELSGMGRRVGSSEEQTPVLFWDS